MKKQFWQNLGINSETLARMPERQVSLLANIMSIESQNEDKEAKKK